ncbi:MAG: response regulator [Eubacteriales bacterium]|nr:response regulator [Eubacteriales bacterium]
MLKVLVVDDEPKVRRGVSRLIEACPDKYEFMGSCSDADGVIDFLGRMVPDVIVTDIRMPNQDGLELINHLKHRYHNLDFIILSGYGDFEYAKKALQYQVFDFLLKPLKADELYEALDGVYQKRQSSRITKSESLEDNYFFNLIRASEPEEETKNLKKLGLYEHIGNCRAAVLDMGEIPSEILKETGRLKEEVKSVLPWATHMYTCFGYQLSMVWEQAPDLENLASVLETLGKQLKGRLFLGVSKQSESCRNLKELYFQALDAAKQYIYPGSKNVNLADDLPDGKQIVFSEQSCERIINAIKTGNVLLMEEKLEEFLGYYRDKRCGIIKLKRHLMLLQRDVAALTEEFGMDCNYSNAILDFVGNIEEIRDFKEVEEVLSRNLKGMAQEANAIAERKMNSYYMNQILSYMQENYMQDISLDNVAEHVNLSVGYLSNYFKGKMGMNFVDYITQLRIEKAKELLIHTNEKIYRVAELVGYQNSQYFVTTFKKKTGVTPAEYRKCLTK